jgi:hypothetical protein
VSLIASHNSYLFGTTGIKKPSPSSTSLSSLTRERIFMWMTNGRRFSIKLSQFAKILGLFAHLAIPKKLHTRRVMAPREMTPMYIPNSGFRAP